MSATIKDIVKKTGLSLGTVSKYLNGHKVKEANKKLIEEAIKDLDYRVNVTARGLRTKKSYLIAMIVPDLSLTFCIDMISAISQTIARESYNMVICVLDGSVYDQEKLNTLSGQNVDGYIVIPADDSDNLVEYLNKLKNDIPVIYMDREVKGAEDKIQLVVNNEQASYEAVCELIDKGHKKIAIITSEEKVSTGKQRLDGYVRALKDNNIDIVSDYIFKGKFSEEVGFGSCKKALELKDKPTAFFMASMSFTKGVVKYLQTSDYYDYKDFALIGFDSEEISDILKPSLSVVYQPVDKMGEYAGNKIMNLISKKEEYKAERIEFDCKLIVKEIPSIGTDGL